jgi:hypothetical protein
MFNLFVFVFTVFDVWVIFIVNNDLLGDGVASSEEESSSTSDEEVTTVALVTSSNNKRDEKRSIERLVRLERLIREKESLQNEHDSLFQMKIISGS